MIWLCNFAAGRGLIRLKLMKLQQLRYLVGVVDNGLNITAAAQALFTSQPGVSKQIRMLEDELSVQIFRRKGKSLSGLTEAGRDIVERARRILSEVDNIKSLSSELSGQEAGEMSIATTHTQARYVLPELLEGFHDGFPGISVRLHQGTSDQIARQVQDHEADFAIASGRSDLFQDLVAFPIYNWERIVIAKAGHPLMGLNKPSLADIVKYPIISYTHSFDDGSELDLAFKEANMTPNVVFTAEDPDVIKTYVRKGMGVGILACMAFDPERDPDLVAFNGAGLFPSSTTWVGFRKDRFLRDYMYAFIEMVAPQVSRDRIDEAIEEANKPNAKIPPVGRSLSMVNQHPRLGQPFATCCSGEFNI